MRIFMKGLAILGFGVAAMIAPQSGHAKEVNSTTLDWAPYYGSELENGGVIAALARAAFEQQGHEMSVEFIPWKRAMAMSKRGKYNAVLGAYYTEERAQDYIYSEPFYNIEVGFMAKKDLGISSYDSLEDLKGHKIGYNDGWAYNEAFENADYLDKDPASNQTLSVRKLFAERINMVAMARGIFRYEVSKLSDASLDNITFIDPPLMIGKLHMMFPKDAEGAEQMKADFNAGMKAIRDNGTYDKILKDYGF